MEHITAERLAKQKNERRKQRVVIPSNFLDEKISQILREEPSEKQRGTTTCLFQNSGTKKPENGMFIVCSSEEGIIIDLQTPEESTFFYILCIEGDVLIRDGNKTFDSQTSYSLSQNESISVLYLKERGCYYIY